MKVKEIMEGEKVVTSEYLINQTSAAEVATMNAKIGRRKKACARLECLDSTMAVIIANYDYISSDDNSEREYNNLLYLLEECSKIEQGKIGITIKGKW